MDTYEHDRVVRSKEYISLLRTCEKYQNKCHIATVIAVISLAVAAILAGFLFPCIDDRNSALDRADTLRAQVASLLGDYNRGYRDGYKTAEATYQEKIEKETKAAYLKGYSDSVSDSVNDDFYEAYFRGHDAGWSMGFSEGSNISYDEGYNDGYRDGLSEFDY